MWTIKTFIKRHPVLAYFALTFAISWGGMFLVIGGRGGNPGTSEQTDPFVYLAMLPGPTIAGVLLTGLVYGKTGLRTLLSRSLRWRVGARWYAVALLTAPLVAMTTLFALLPTSPVFLPGIFASNNKVSLLLSGIVAALWVIVVSVVQVRQTLPRQGKEYINMDSIKMTMKWIAILAIFILPLAIFVTSPVKANHNASLLSEENSYEEIDTYLEEQLKALNIPGASLAIVEGDQIVHLKGFGVSGQTGETPTPQTLFFICSLTKSFTALAVMQLVEARKIELDAPVQRYLPWFTLADPQAAAQITVRHLLVQSSGLSQTTGWKTMVNFNDSPDASEKQARQLATFKPNRPVGSAFEYSNTNYNLLGLIIEAASGEKYADYVQKHILAPLAMTHTYTSKAVAKQENMSTGYISWFGFPRPVPNLPYPGGSLASGQLISSAEDMAHYLIAQLNGGRYGDAQILSPAGIAEMHSPGVDANSMGVDLGDYGMGWIITSTSQGDLIWHDGTNPNYFSYMALLPDQNRGLVLLVNANQMVINFSLAEIGGQAASLLAGVQPESIPWAVVPWSLRAFLIIPVLQLLGVLMTLRAVRRWRMDASRRPGPIRKWVHIILPAILNLVLVFCALYLVTSGVLKFYLFYMADLTWLALICGSFALVWIFVRTGLIFRTLQEPWSSRALVGQFSKAQ